MIKYSHTFFLLLLCVTVTALKAQSKSGIIMGWRFQSYNTVQVHTGGSATSGAVQSVNGFKQGIVFGGIGTGVDFYRQITIPLFAEARVDVWGRKDKIQLALNAGFHIPINNKNHVLPDKTGEIKPGRLLAAGLYYCIPRRKSAVIFGAGMDQKKFSQLADRIVWDPVTNSTKNIPVNDVYEFNRVWLSIGVVF